MAGECGAVGACGDLLRRVVALREGEQPIPEESLSRAQTELVRIIGNLCFDHGECQNARDSIRLLRLMLVARVDSCR